MHKKNTPKNGASAKYFWEQIWEQIKNIQGYLMVKNGIYHTKIQ